MFHFRARQPPGAVSPGFVMTAIERTIPRLVKAAAERFGSRHAIEDGDTTLSFIELHAAGLEAARAFAAAGVEKGDRVAFWAPNLHEWIVAAIGS